MVFNSSIEIGLRCLIILNTIKPKKCKIERLIYLDYLTRYTKDAQIGKENLHPEYEFRMTEIFSRRSIFQEALLLMSSKALIDINYDERGINYSAGVNTEWFLENLESTYAKELQIRAKIVDNELGMKTDSELKQYIFYK